MVMILKPAWVTCDGRALMSIDIHPDGDRFAVGGQGVDCGRVSIWNMKPILDSAAAKNKDVPKLLTQMDHHEGCVNCVRWSHDGRFLASAGDDKLVRYPIEVSNKQTSTGCYIDQFILSPFFVNLFRNYI
jgi:protein HIRA/HIR1